MMTAISKWSRTVAVQMCAVEAVCSNSSADKNHAGTDKNSVVKSIKNQDGWYAHQLDGAQLDVEAV